MKPIFLFLLNILGLFLFGQNNPALAPQEFTEKTKNPHTIILDVRTLEEYNAGHIENAINIDYRTSGFNEEIKKLDSSNTYLVYCRSGKRSASAINSLKKAGFKNLYDLEGGIIDWNRNNLPLTDVYSDLLSLEEYHELIQSSPISLAYFFIPSSDPDLKIESIFTKLVKEYKITILTINTDENKTLSKSFSQKGLPVLIGYKDGEIQWERIGLLDELEIVNLIKLFSN